MAPWVALPIAAAILMGGCVAGPDFIRPDPPRTSHYTRSSPQHLAAAGIKLQPDQPPPLDWWALFDSPRLNATMQLALAGNRDLASAQQSLARAAELAHVSTSARYPQVNLDAGAGRQKLGAAALGSTFKVPPFTYYSIGPAISYTLDYTGGVRRGIEAARAQVDIEGYQLDAAWLSLTGHVALQALQIAATRAQIANSQTLLDEDSRNVQLVQSAFDAGSVSRVDVVAAQSQLANDQTLLPPLQQQLSASQHALSVLVGRLPADWTPPDFDLADLSLPTALPMTIPSQLVRRRPDILAAEAHLHEATAQVGVATADLYPRIDLTAAGSMQATTLGHLFDASSAAGSLLGSLTAPIFDHGARRARQHAAQDELRAALAHYEQTVLISFEQVADQLDALDHDARLLKAEQHAVDTATSNLDLTRQSYSAGNVGVLQLLDAERAHEQAQMGWVQARAQRYRDTMQLLLAMGGAPPNSAGSR